MNSFFRICIYICLLFIIFNLTWAFIYEIGAFEGIGEEGTGAEDTSDWLTTFTGLSGGMLGLWGLVTGAALIIGGLASLITQSTTPIGIAIFSTVFWTSYNATLHIINIGNYMPGSFMLLATVGITVLFIAAVVGMLTGSG